MRQRRNKKRKTNQKRIISLFFLVWTPQQFRSVNLYLYSVVNLFWLNFCEWHFIVFSTWIPFLLRYKQPNCVPNLSGKIASFVYKFLHNRNPQPESHQINFRFFNFYFTNNRINWLLMNRFPMFDSSSNNNNFQNASDFARNKQFFGFLKCLFRSTVICQIGIKDTTINENRFKFKCVITEYENQLIQSLFTRTIFNRNIHKC